MNNLIGKSDDILIIANKKFSSRLILGTGKYPNLKQAFDSIHFSECEMVTVAVRRAQSAKAYGKSNLIDGLQWNNIWLLPNTAGCQTAEDAIRVAILGREMAKKMGQHENNFIKLEVISDSQHLLPDPIGTLKAAEYLVKKGFAVLPYISPDPVLAKHLEDVGCSTVMPLGSPIGSGKGIENKLNVQIIIENANIPVIIDAGIGTPSDASLVMEWGASAVLVNSAVAHARKTTLMAKAMKSAVIAGRSAFLAGRMPIQTRAIASSTDIGLIV
uniref:thiamin biosynthesis protein G n=1 Tax=Timspurckia oligopyrenoides TaxID=708627 RepID=UPI001FCD3192|nr:thiamin biosynthesis protein G [Timspurckia oligopyrenoides]UNJ17488.1 thiamin biosynthesis protein G [Timspurckia oligopyrenoides]